MKLLKVILILTLLMSVIGCGMLDTNKNSSSIIKEKEEISEISNSSKPTPVTIAYVETHYKTLESIVKDSVLVAEVQVSGEAKQIDYKGATFIIHDLNVKDVIVGNQDLKNKTIKLMEVGLSPKDLNVINDKKKYLVFLTRYEGPVTDDTYIITGVYQGKFKVNSDGSLKYSGQDVDGVTYFQEEFTKKNKLKDAKVKIKEIKQKSKK
ncbi:hypothetical protein [Alkalihalobacillus sp. AL-G]|uniref:hypothetical protein n=1 Tax=Alkalihalobacillus sp. AL-G TaxID=2926399 RepID=UPI00272AC431|nr:hypothetical protein [Alkalihalobacillus sp. AL-G]WLD93617.1 hypothetical protein MOJ78_01365 [Alkalihalobacillus sp. AL-G]